MTRISILFKQISLTLFLLTGVSSLSFANDKLVFALDLIRHGDRTAIGEIPKAPHPWKEGRGQLTALGMKQEYELGLKLHQRYMVASSLLPQHYQASNLYVRSTDYDRTIMSALSLLSGLYPLGSGPNLADGTPALPGNYQPIPVHSVPTAQDSSLLIDLGSDSATALLEHYVYGQKEWQDNLAKLQPQFAHWSNITGANIETPWDVLELGDTLYTYKVHNIPLPQGLSEEDAEQIINTGKWLHAALFKPEQVGDALGKTGLEKIKDYLKRAIEHQSPAKFVLISAHDVTILGVLSAMHTPLESTPPYASDLNFSVYESAGGNYSIKVTLNDKPVNIPGCNGNVCTWSQLQKL